MGLGRGRAEARRGEGHWRGGHQQHGDADLQQDPDDYNDVTAQEGL
jgi:hypothetical protein